MSAYVQNARKDTSVERKNAWKNYSAKDEKAIEALASGYIDFISECKTERECAAKTIEMARAAGYISLDEARAAGTQLKTGDRVYAESLGLHSYWSDFHDSRSMFRTNKKVFR